MDSGKPKRHLFCEVCGEDAKYLSVAPDGSELMLCSYCAIQAITKFDGDIYELVRAVEIPSKK